MAKKKKKGIQWQAIITLNPATNHELTLWTCVMEGEDKDEAHNEGDGNVGGAAWGLSWTGVSSSLRRQILLHYWWKWTAEGFRKGQCWAVSACHVTLIDTAFAAAQEPFCPGLPFQIAAWFIYRDNRLNNQRGVSGLSCGFWADVPSKRQRLVSLQNTRKKRSSCKTWRVRTNSSTGWTILNHQTEGARLCYKNRMGLTIIELTVKPATEWAYVRCECSGLEKSDQTTTRIPKKVAILFKMQIKTECNRLQMNCVYWQGVPEPMNEYALYSHAVNLSLSGIAMLMLLKDHCSARKWQNPHFEQAVRGFSSLIIFWCPVSVQLFPVLFCMIYSHASCSALTCFNLCCFSLPFYECPICFTCPLL